MKIKSRFSNESYQRQAEAGECGLACLAMVLSHHGYKTNLASLRREFPVSSRGATLKTIIEIGDSLGLHSRPLRLELPSLIHVDTPAVLHWNMNHFVVLIEVVKNKKQGMVFTVADPAAGICRVDEAEFSKRFTGICLELIPGEKFVKKDVREPLKLSQLWTRLRGIVPALTRILSLSFILQAISLLSPFFMQISIDSTIPAQDKDFALVLLTGFAGLWLVNTISSWARSSLIVDLSGQLLFQTAINLFRHTIFLPIAWFEKRHLGDVVSRFNSLQPINELISKGLVASIVDGVLVVSTLVLMIVYSPVLTSITFSMVIFYGFIKYLYYTSAKMCNANLLSAQALENSSFIESIRGISAIKLFCQEGGRQKIWQNRKSEVMDANIKIGKLSAVFDTSLTAVIGLETLLFVYISTKMVIDGVITLGMVFAYQAYKQNFIGATTRLIEQIMSYKLLDVHLDRLSDLVYAEPEDNLYSSQDEDGPLGVIELIGVGFRYGIDSPEILKSIDLKILPGETVAVVGPSGVGKSTLLKIICCLLEPNKGEIRINGMPLIKYGIRRFRGKLGVVSQEDTLFAGSIAENVTFFDIEYDHSWLVECCKSASIHEDIIAMPMGYETSVGDMGANLSGGQKQRVLLARALYKKPSVLIMDEGTAHLDIATERKVANTIRELGTTRVIVAHRPETVRQADRVFILHAGKLIEIAKDAQPCELGETPAVCGAF